MNKVFFQFLILAGLFFGCWTIMSQFDLMTIFHVKEIGRKTEHKLGTILYKSIEDQSREITDSAARNTLDLMKQRLCANNGIAPADLKFHIIVSNEVNAFALPDNQIVIYTGLIAACNNPEELCGVIGHEIGHIEHRDIMKKLVREIGLASIISLTSGNGGGEILQRALKLLSSSAYDRKQESEADQASIDYMLRSEIDPCPFADFLDSFSVKNEKDIPKELFWIANHPDSKSRAVSIRNYIKNKKNISRPILSNGDWNSFKHIIHNDVMNDDENN